MPRLEFKDLRISYSTVGETGRGLVHAVDGVSLALEPGSTLGLAGESGCGKSTLALSVLRLLPPNAAISGQILLGDDDITTMKWGRLRAVRWTDAAIVFQGAMHSLNPVQRVGGQISEALRIHRASLYPDASARKARVDELLTLVDLPVSKAVSYPHELSGGQKQRIMIAMALACDPDLIIADEPTTALDVIVQAQVLKVLTDLVRDRSLSLIMISHDLTVLAATCERICVMREGKVVEDGPSKQVMTDPQHPHTKALAAAFPLIGDPSSRKRLLGYTAPDAPGVPGAEDGQAADERPAGDVVLEVKDLGVTYGSRAGRVKAVDGVDIALRRGEIVALVGQSGSGKTTLARTILGLERPTRGSVHYQGKPLGTSRKALKAYRREVQFVLQDPHASLNPKHSVYEAVAEGPRIHGLPGDERDIVANALRQAELSPPESYFTAIPQELSGGQRQRVVIAGALSLSPDLPGRRRARGQPGCVGAWRDPRPAAETQGRARSRRTGHHP